MDNIPLAIVFVTGAILLLLLPGRMRSAAFLLFPLIAFILLLRLEPGTSVTMPFLDYELMPLRADRLSIAFGYVFVIIAFMGGIYAYHVDDAAQQSGALLYVGSALGVVFAGDLLTLFVFWEIMAVASVILIWARRTPQSRRAGMRYVMVHLLGGSALLPGVLWHWLETGSLAFGPMEGGMASYLILFAFAINAAIPPLHAWLADAYPEGTVTGSVFLSAFTTKAAVYALARGFAGFDLLIWAGVIMALYGVVFAVLENDIRRLLAYHIISQVGYMVTAVGIGTEMAINGATAHAFAHILYKGLLFMGAGAVLYSTGRSKLTELGGLAKTMPLIMALYMVGAFSISGVPLFSGFVSKSLAVYAAERSHLGLVVLLLHLASVGTFLHTGLKLPYFTWFGPDRGLKSGPIPGGMYMGMGLVALINVAIGVYPTLLYNLLPFPVSYKPYTAAHLQEAGQLLVFTGLAFWLLVKKLGGEPTITLDTDWYYRKPAPLMYRLSVHALSRLFGAAESLTLRIVDFVIRVAANPAGYFLDGVESSANSVFGAANKSSWSSRDPGQYRLSMWSMLLLVLLVFATLMIWIAFAVLWRLEI